LPTPGILDTMFWKMFQLGARLPRLVRNRAAMVPTMATREPYRALLAVLLVAFCQSLWRRLGLRVRGAGDAVREFLREENGDRGIL